MQPLFVRNRIIIRAVASRVWEALTDPEQTKQYMFGCEAVSDWKIGSDLMWKGNFDGKELIAVKGKVVDIKKDRFLAYTAIDPNSSIPDVPENYTTVTYTLTPEGENTLLEASQGDFARVAGGQARYEETNRGGGWQPILEAIKNLVESDT